MRLELRGHRMIEIGRPLPGRLRFALFWIETFLAEISLGVLSRCNVH
jgi:hypothetical protein